MFFYAYSCINEKALISVYLNTQQPENANLVVKSDSEILVSHIIASLKFLLTKDE